DSHPQDAVAGAVVAIFQLITENVVDVVLSTRCGVIQGLGSALLEGFVFNDKGRMLNPSFVDYKLLTAKDLPRKMSAFFVETPQLDGPYGARGIGEHPMVSVPGAIGNALRDALGIDFHDLPLNSERVYLALKRARTAKA
ncbi:MAG TPA: molybdopterin-dependent oxidoreductase, partial [Polyangiaceae bacterium]|nr:molybdopterin-dependent oxidoreductase [Polyangiaceae bacterium]